MIIINQTFNFGSTVPVTFYIETITGSKRHWDRKLELYYVLSGKMDIQVKEQSYSLDKDSLILINSYDIHTINSEQCILAVFEIDLSKYDHNLIDEAKLHFDCNSATDVNDVKMYSLKQLLARFIKFNTTDSENNELLNKSLSYALLHNLMEYFRVEDTYDYTQRKTQINRIEEILRYINQHFKEGLTLSEIAEKFYLSVPYISKIFKDYTGSVFTEYMNGIRLSYAVNEILHTNQSIEIIGQNSGFPNTRAFVNTFKKQYNMLPSGYRKEASNKQKSSGTKVMFNFEHNNYLGTLAKYLEVNDSYSNERKNLLQIIEVSPITTSQKGYQLKHTFKTTTSIGKAKHILYSECQDMLRQLQKDVGFKYIKFHGLLDDDMMVYSENEFGEPELNFTLIDMILDFLLSIDLKPFMQLTFMPRALAKTHDRTQFYIKSIISYPKDMKKWKYLVHHLLLHLESRYGPNEVEKWPFSLWNEPDSLDIMFGLGSVESYFEFYRETYLTVKEINPNIIFGCPSLMTPTIENGEWVTIFLDLCKKHQCNPGFLNFHFYPLDLEDNVLTGQAQTFTHIIFRKSPDALKDSIYQILRNSKLFHWDIDTIYLTEWNSSISHRDLLNDTAFKAPYIVKNILENYDRLDSFGYFFLTDFAEEVKLANDLFHGGLGMFTYNGVKKSIYFAFCLLNKLGNRLIGKGNGYFITKEKESYQIMLYNYQHFSDLYASGELFDMTFVNRYTPFPNTKNKKFIIPLNEMPNSDYIITETILNQEHGSAFDKWVELGAVPLETQDDINYLKSVSVPYIKKRYISVIDNHITISFELEPHEVRLVEIHRKYTKN